MAAVPQHIIKKPSHSVLHILCKREKKMCPYLTPDYLQLHPAQSLELNPNIGQIWLETSRVSERISLELMTKPNKSQLYWHKNTEVYA